MIRNGTVSRVMRFARLLLTLLLLAVLAGCAGANDVGAGQTGVTGGEETGTSTSSQTLATTMGKTATRSQGASGRGETQRETTSGEERMPMDAGRMNLRAAVGQMFVVSVSGTGPDRYIETLIRERNAGGVLLFGYNMQNEQQTRTLVSSLQQTALDTEPAIPLFVAVDQEGGEVSSVPWATPQPAAAELGARGDAQEAGAVAQQIGQELCRAGINTNFAPVVDTGFGAAIGSRSFGEDPDLVARMGTAAVAGFEDAGIVSAAKHFPNHGVATTDSHVGLPVVNHDLQTILSYDLPPFRAAVEAGVPMIMAGHLIYPAIDPEQPASLSPEAIRFLREELSFGGVVVTDDLSMVGASGDGSPENAAVAAVKAGADLLIVSGTFQEQAAAHDAVVSAVETGEIPRSRVDRAVDRILKIKKNYSLC